MSAPWGIKISTSSEISLPCLSLVFLINQVVFSKVMSRTHTANPLPSTVSAWLNMLCLPMWCQWAWGSTGRQQAVLTHLGLQWWQRGGLGSARHTLILPVFWASHMLEVCTGDVGESQVCLWGLCRVRLQHKTKHRRLRADLTISPDWLEEGCSQTGAGLSCQEISDGRRGHSLKLPQGRLGFYIRHKFFTERVIRFGMGCPGRRCSRRPWRCLRRLGLALGATV